MERLTFFETIKFIFGKKIITGYETDGTAFWYRMRKSGMFIKRLKNGLYKHTPYVGKHVTFELGAIVQRKFMDDGGQYETGTFCLVYDDFGVWVAVKTKTHRYSYTDFDDLKKHWLLVRNP